MNEHVNINVVRNGYSRFQEGDISGLLDLFTDDIEWTLPKVEAAFFPTEIRGKEGVGEFFAKLAEVETITHFEPKEFIASGDRVVVLGDSTATVNETGREFSTNWVHVFTVTDSKVSGFLELYDTAEVNRAYSKAATA